MSLNEPSLTQGQAIPPAPSRDLVQQPPPAMQPSGQGGELRNTIPVGFCAATPPVNGSALPTSNTVQLPAPPPTWQYWRDSSGQYWACFAGNVVGEGLGSNPSLVGPPGPQGNPGVAGPPGQAATITVGNVTASSPGSQPSITNSGSATSAVLNFVLPQGNTGPAGQTGAPGSSISIKGSVPTSASLPVTGNTVGDIWIAQDSGNGYEWQGASWLNIGQFRGVPGPPGPVGPAGPSINIKGEVATSASLPTTGNAVNDGWIAQDTGDLWLWNGTTWINAGKITGPQGPAGATGPVGPQGANGASATVAVGTVTTLPAGSPATVTNAGTSLAALFNFGIPQGQTGATGNPGPTGATGPVGPAFTPATTGTGNVFALQTAPTITTPMITGGATVTGTLTTQSQTITGTVTATGNENRTGFETINNSGAALAPIPSGYTTPGLWVGVPPSSSNAPVSTWFDYYGYGEMVFRLAGGTPAAPTVPAAGQTLGDITWMGYAPGGYQTSGGALVRASPGEAWSSTAQGTQVAIGVTPFGSLPGSLAWPLQVTGNFGGSVAMYGAGIACSIYANTAGTTDLYPLQIQAPNTSDCFMRLISARTWGIGTKSSGNFLIADYSAFVSRLQIDTAGVCYNQTGTWTAFSDPRLKEDIAPYGNGLDIINALQPIQFRYNGKGGTAKDGMMHYGLDAEATQKVLPECIHTLSDKLEKDDTEPTDILAADGTGPIVLALINAVKELTAKVAHLEAAARSSTVAPLTPSPAPTAAPVKDPAIEPAQDAHLPRPVTPPYSTRNGGHRRR